MVRFENPVLEIGVFGNRALTDLTHTTDDEFPAVRSYRVSP